MTESAYTPPILHPGDRVAYYKTDHSQPCLAEVVSTIGGGAVVRAFIQGGYMVYGSVQHLGNPNRRTNNDDGYWEVPESTKRLEQLEARVAALEAVLENKAAWTVEPDHVEYVETPKRRGRPPKQIAAEPIEETEEALV